MVSAVWAGLIAGLAAGVVMSMVMMAYTVWRGEGMWKMPNLIAAMWLGEDATGERLKTATAVPSRG